MTRSRILAAVFAVSLAPTAAFAHAHLVSAIPAAGATVKTSPDELQLTFTEGVVPALSGVEIATSAGVAVPTAKPSVEPGKPTVLHVRPEHALAAATYVVHWRVVATDTHKTSGTYKFTVAP